MLAGRRTESAQGSRIEMHLMSRQRQRVKVRALYTDITFGCVGAESGQCQVFVNESHRHRALAYG